MGSKLTLSFILPLLLLLVITIFWHQEIKYLTPAPVPQNYQPVQVRETIDLSAYGLDKQQKPVHLHFFNPACPCSRFSTAHFVSLVKEYGNEVDFTVVLTYSQDTLAVKQMLASYGLQLPVIIDDGELLAQKCGVYASPQAVIIDTRRQLYYRGNYNRSRYCTDQQTSFARQALKALIAGNAPPEFSELATTAYGCGLKDNTFSFIDFLNF